MHAPDRLAFVDVETTGLSPTANRIAEIGVVTVEEGRVERWTTFLKGGGQGARDAPSFAEIAVDLRRRLDGRLFVAHNARFDYAFVRAEFERAGIAFEAPVLCSVMLSRKLRPHFAHHDLDSLASHHGLRVEERHRALPDADLVWQWWQGLAREFDDVTLGRAVEALLAGPVLPARLDHALVEALPSAPGAYVMRAEDGSALAIGAALNLRGHAVDYFRIDRASSRALEYAHRVAAIGYRRTRGMLGARLHAATLMRIAWPRRAAPEVSWRLSPEAVPCVDAMPIDDCRAPRHRESFGLFDSHRKARNALARLASRRGLCHAMLGLEGECAACEHASCGGALDRKRHLLRVFEALRPLRVDAWPFAGPVGVRERDDLHVIDGWQFLGTARDESEARELAQSSRPGFDRRVYAILQPSLARTPRDRVVDLSEGRRAAATLLDAAGASPPP